jgi:hypothetical protein
VPKQIFFAVLEDLESYTGTKARGVSINHLWDEYAPVAANGQSLHQYLDEVRFSGLPQAFANGHRLVLQHSCTRITKVWQPFVETTPRVSIELHSLANSCNGDGIVNPGTVLLNPLNQEYLGMWVNSTHKSSLTRA